MNQNQQREKLVRLDHTGLAVFHSVPMNDKWNTMEIGTEVQRRGQHLTIKQLERVLWDLRQRDLIKVFPGDKYQQRPVELRCFPLPYQDKTTEEPMVEQTNDPIAIMQALAERANELANGIIQLGADIAAAGKVINEKFAAKSEAGDQLAQLKAALKSIGV